MLRKARLHQRLEDDKPVYQAACWEWFKRTKGIEPSTVGAIVITQTHVWVIEKFESACLSWAREAETADFTLELRVLTRGRHDRKSQVYALRVKPDELLGPKNA